MRIKSPIITTAQGVKTQKPFRPSTVRLVLEVKTNWAARIDGVVQLAVDLPLELARRASRLLRRAATRVEQRLAAAAAKRPLTTAAKMARRSQRSKSPAIARKRPARKSVGIAAEIRAGRKL